MPIQISLDIYASYYWLCVTLNLNAVNLVNTIIRIYYTLYNIIQPITYIYIVGSKVMYLLVKGSLDQIII